MSISLRPTGEKTRPKHGGGGGNTGRCPKDPWRRRRRLRSGISRENLQLKRKGGEERLGNRQNNTSSEKKSPSFSPSDDGKLTQGELSLFQLKKPF